MNKKFLSAILFGALMVTSTGTFVSCKDYDDDIDNLQGQIDGVKSQIAALESKINEGKWITSVTPSADGLAITMSDGQTYNITNGKNGADGANGTNGTNGTEWTISEDGFWVCNGEKTDVKAVGKDGDKGETGEAGQQEVKFENGKWYLWNGTEFVEFKGAEATTGNVPYYYTDPNDPNYTILVVFDENGENKKEIRMPMSADLGQIVVLGEDLDIAYHRFNGLHKNTANNGVKDATWDGKKEMPAKGEYMLTANQNAVYVQVVPATYDISKLNFKLVNTKGDEAPVVFGTPVPTTEAVSRAVSESGVFAIPYTLKDMTADEMKAYEKNIEGKALSLVANENVRSTYTYGVALNGASDDITSFADVTVPVESLGEPVTVVPDNAAYVYDSYLVMKDAAAKADSVRYGISIDGMTISYSKDIKKGAAVEFTVRQVTAKAMVNATKSVKVTFGKAASTVTEIVLAEEKHSAVATYTNAAGQSVKNQFIVADFAPYFEQVASTDGERLIWNQDMKFIAKTDVKLVWDELNEYGESVVEGGIDVTTKLLSGIDVLTADGVDKVNNADITNNAHFGKLKIQFSEQYEGITLSNGTLKAIVSMKNKAGEEVQTVEVPFTISSPTDAEIASHIAWDSQYYLNNVLTVVDATSLNLKSLWKGATLVTTDAAKASNNDKITVDSSTGMVTLAADGKKNTVYAVKDLKVQFIGNDTHYNADGTVKSANTGRAYGIGKVSVKFATTKGDSMIIGDVAVMCSGKSVTVYDYRHAAGALTYKLVDFAGDAYTVDASTTVAWTLKSDKDLIDKVELVKRDVTDKEGQVVATDYDLKVTSTSDKISVDTTVKGELTFTGVKDSEGDAVNVTVPVTITVKAAI